MTKRAMAVRIVKRLQSAGYEAYFAGGCVRDALRKKTPVDYDIAASAKPAEVARLFKKTIPVGKAFGVMTVVEGGINFEVTTFRTEGAYKDGRHPSSVKFSSLAEDAKRRDFTINGMFYDPMKRKFIDLVGGRADLKRHLVRTIGKPAERFAEDKLRVLRAVRFAAELDFRLHPETRRAIQKHASGIKAVSAERIREELKKILLSPNRRKGIKLLDKTGLLRRILPEVSRLKGVKQPPQFHPEGDVYVHTLACLKHLPPKMGWELVLATLLHDIGKPRTFMITDLPAPRPGKFFVYAIKCDNDSIYIGQTDNLLRRWQEHLEGTAARWTVLHKPISIVYYDEYGSREESVKREQELKTGFGRKWLKREIAAGRARQAGRIRFHEHERVGKEMSEKICRRLKLSNKETEKVAYLVDKHMLFKDIKQMRVSTLKRLFSQPFYPELSELHRADRLASDLDLKPHYYAQRMYRKLSREMLKPPPLINGYDLIKMKLKPGPLFGKILKAVEEAQLEKTVKTRDEALVLARLSASQAG